MCAYVWNQGRSLEIILIALAILTAAGSWGACQLITIPTSNSCYPTQVFQQEFLKNKPHVKNLHFRTGFYTTLKDSADQGETKPSKNFHLNTTTLDHLKHPGQNQFHSKPLTSFPTAPKAKTDMFCLWKCAFLLPRWEATENVWLAEDMLDSKQTGWLGAAKLHKFMLNPPRWTLTWAEISSIVLTVFSMLTDFNSQLFFVFSKPHLPLFKNDPRSPRNPCFVSASPLKCLRCLLQLQDSAQVFKYQVAKFKGVKWRLK